jgi:NAD(P)-dependent dehydrogenase (short-subunit alcohol dehydrogenase family)
LGRIRADPAGWPLLLIMTTIVRSALITGSTAGGQARFISADLSSARSVAELATQSDKLLGGVDILVNNAGIFPTA